MFIPRFTLSIAPALTVSITDSSIRDLVATVAVIAAAMA